MGNVYVQLAGEKQRRLDVQQQLASLHKHEGASRAAVGHLARVPVNGQNGTRVVSADTSFTHTAGAKV